MTAARLPVSFLVERNHDHFFAQVSAFYLEQAHMFKDQINDLNAAIRAMTSEASVSNAHSH